VPRRGVTVGKFYPPHRGHRRLIEAARSRCDELFVLVASRPREDPPAAKRLGWLQQMFPEVHFILVEDTYPEAPAVWAEVTVRELGFTPDVAFAGEDYGAAWAGEMGCGFEMVDRTRGASECAGRTVRSDPMGHWQCLDPIVRAYYARRVAVVGAESTGTTTIARNLAEHYQTVLVPEYGRDYYEDRMRSGRGGAPWTTAEFVQIAERQAEWEELAACLSDRVLICDTDPFATEIWHERYVGTISQEVARISVSRRYALYILTGTDIPFVQDGFRDGEHVREWMHERFVKELRARDKAFVIVEGDPITRLKAATEAIDRVLGLSRLYRPVGPKELDLITESGWSSFPPRLEWQPIFYPVLNFEYAARIASEWNVKDSGYGAVTTCWVRRQFLDRYEVHQVGGRATLEYWIPAEELTAFNAAIVGGIQVVREYGSRVGAPRGS